MGRAFRYSTVLPPTHSLSVDEPSHRHTHTPVIPVLYLVNDGSATGRGRGIELSWNGTVPVGLEDAACQRLVPWPMANGAWLTAQLNLWGKGCGACG